MASQVLRERSGSKETGWKSIRVSLLGISGQELWSGDFSVSASMLDVAAFFKEGVRQVFVAGGHSSSDAVTIVR